MLTCNVIGNMLCEFNIGVTLTAPRYPVAMDWMSQHASVVS